MNDLQALVAGALAADLMGLKEALSIRSTIRVDERGNYLPEIDVVDPNSATRLLVRVELVAE